ncbi:MAG TPA: lysophospholipid acyltransferase family protein, partial [Cyclobacteriaceae bacterium]
YLFLMPISSLPSWILYRISDFMYLVLYRIAGYRKKVVSNNIKNSFPEFSLAQQKLLERQFYKHFCDLVMESIKAFTISKKELQKRFVERNPELFQKYYDNGQHVTLVGGHSGNWELYAISVALNLPHQPVALYAALHSAFLNSKILASRSKFGLWMKSYAEVKEMMRKEIERPIAVIFGSDQSPNIKQQPYWTEFLHQETGVQFGAEKFARDNNTPVIFGFIHKTKRGHYEMEYKLVCEQPNELPLGAITERHTRMLEEDIRKEPSFWLWTHKRWKRKKIDFINYQNEMRKAEKMAT